MLFKYYEILPCVKKDGDTISFTGDPKWDANLGIHYTPDGALKEALRKVNGNSTSVFWTLYGRHYDSASDVMLAQAIGDFDSFDSAYRVMQAMLTPIRQAADKATNHWLAEGGNGAPEGIGDLEDILNQSTTEERL